MITSKQRAYLRGLANDIPAIMQVGKGGLSENLTKTFSDALEARELVKFTVLVHLFVRRQRIRNDVENIQPHLLHERPRRRKMPVVRGRERAAVNADAHHCGSSIAGFFFARR